MVDVLATNAVAAENGWMLIKPGDPDLSFLVRKLERPGVGEGAPMPMDGHKLQTFWLDLIRRWVANGAVE